MDCRDIEQLIDAYLDRELRPEEAERLEGHLDACAACSQQYRPVIEALRGGDELPVPAGLRERVLAAVLDVQMQAEPSGLLYVEDEAAERCATAVSAVAPLLTEQWHTGTGLNGRQNAVHQIQPARRGFSRWLLQPSSIGSLAACVVLAFSALLAWQIRPVAVAPDTRVTAEVAEPHSTFLTQAFAMGQAQAAVLRTSANPAPMFAQALAIDRLMQPPDEAAVLANRRSLRDLPTDTPPGVPEITILITGLKLGV
jgi:predicted anti-sigma-YlaC factor YlaD